MDKTELITKLNSGEIKLHEIEKFLSPEESIQVRREVISSQLSVNLDSTSNISFDPNTIINRNCENVIGQVGIPLGVAGPVHVRGVEEGKFYIPMATTEGALVASVSRGAKLINEAGGARVIHIYHGITRAPVFTTKNLDDSLKFVEFIESNIEKFRELTKQTSNHATLLEIKPFVNGRTVWIRFAFDTSDAMGMNMAVEATDLITRFIKENYEVDLIAISGNVCIDKKTGLINEIDGRGREIQAEVEISRELCERILKCTPERLFEVGYKKLWQGSRIAGSFGINAHAANMVAAIFMATGQDIAHTVDISNTITTFELKGDSIYVNVKVPSLNVATVGGGTHLKPQNDLLNLILTNTESKKIAQNKTIMLAQIIGTAVLAGEISLNAAFASQTIAKSHEDLGRGNK